MFSLRRRVWTAVLAISVLTIACGSDDGSGGSTGDQGSTQVSFVLPSTLSVSDSAYYVGIEKGFFEEEGIDLSIKPGQGYQFAMTAVGVGEADFGAVDLPTIFLNKARTPEMPVIGIAALQNRAPYAIFSKASGSNVRQPEDLEGTEIYLSNLSSVRDIVDAWARQRGVGGYTWKNVNPQSVTQLFLAGRIDTAVIFVTQAPETKAALAESGDELVVLPLYKYGMDNFIGSMFVVNTDFADENPEVVKGFIRAAIESWQWTLENPEEAAAIAQKEIPTIDIESGIGKMAAYDDVITDGGRIPLEDIGQIDPDRVLSTLEWMTQAFHTTVEPEQLYTTEYLE